MKFLINVTKVSSPALFSRSITAQISNTGSDDAHNVWFRLEAFSAGSRVQLNGQDYVRVDIGNLAAGAAVTEQVTVSVALFDGLRISQKGAALVLTINSDELTQNLSYEYKP